MLKGIMSITICPQDDRFQILDVSDSFMDGFYDISINTLVDESFQSIITDENIRVDISSILIRLENLKKRIRDNSNLVEWILIPEGRDYRRVKKNEKPSEDKTFIFNYEEIQRLRQLGEKKKTFYEGTPYVAKAVGLRKYRGYIAYIYANGKVILDREYNDDNPKYLTFAGTSNLSIERPLK